MEMRLCSGAVGAEENRITDLGACRNVGPHPPIHKLSPKLIIYSVSYGREGKLLIRTLFHTNL